MKFQFDEEKALAALLHIAREVRTCGEKVGFHKIFKILYFADREHLATWGRPITGDFFVAMTHGPVPSGIYDMLKSVQGECRFIPPEQYAPFFEVHAHWVTAKQEPNLDVLSKSDQAALNRAIEENARLTFRQLVDKSHGPAWDNATKDGKMSYKRMAQEAGADSEMLAYIRHNAANSTLFA